MISIRLLEFIIVISILKEDVKTASVIKSIRQESDDYDSLDDGPQVVEESGFKPYKIQSRFSNIMLPECYLTTSKTMIQTVVHVPRMNYISFDLPKGNIADNITICMDEFNIYETDCNIWNSKLTVIVYDVDKVCDVPSGFVCINNALTFDLHNRLVQYNGNSYDIKSKNLPFKLNRGSNILIDNNIISCNSIKLCNDMTRFLIYSCMPVWVICLWSAIFILVISLISMSILFCTYYCSCHSANYRKNLNKKRKNLRHGSYKYTTKRSKYGSKETGLCFFLASLCSSRAMNLCTSLVSEIAPFNLCHDRNNRTLCSTTTSITMSHIKQGDSYCFINSDNEINYLKIIDIKAHCNYAIEYYTPNYQPRTGEYWRCHNAGECFNGKLDKTENTKYYLDISNQKITTDHCFYSSAKCIRLYFNYTVIGQPFEVKKCISIYYRMTLEIKLHDKGSLTTKKITLRPNDDLKIGNFTLKYFSSTGRGMRTPVIFYNNKIYTKPANPRSVYSHTKFGSVQCPSYESALTFNQTACKLSMIDIISMFGTTVFINSQDLISSEDMNTYQHELSDDLEDIYETDLWDPITLKLIDLNGNSYSQYQLLENIAISNLSLEGSSELFHGATLSFCCSGKSRYTLRCDIENFILICDEGCTSSKITISSAWKQGVKICDVSDILGNTVTTRLRYSLHKGEVTLGSSVYRLDHEILSIQDGIFKFGIRDLLLDYFISNMKYLMPIGLTLGGLFSMKLINGLKASLD